jgi:dephospho-CoA kinase
MAQRTIRVALTGGIGSGKSEVAQMLARRGAIIVDADQVARQIVEPGQPALAEIAAEFGPGVLLEDGTLNRPALAEVAFADPAKLARLNAITHPRIADRTRQLFEAAPTGSVVVYDMPLLVENGLTQGWDLIVVVDAPDDVRVQRLTEFRGLPEADVRARMASQASREERNAAADVVLDNSADRASLKVQVEALWEGLRLATIAGE